MAVPVSMLLRKEQSFQAYVKDIAHITSFYEVELARAQTLFGPAFSMHLQASFCLSHDPRQHPSITLHPINTTNTMSDRPSRWDAPSSSAAPASPAVAKTEIKPSDAATAAAAALVAKRRWCTRRGKHRRTCLRRAAGRYWLMSRLIRMRIVSNPTLAWWHWLLVLPPTAARHSTLRAWTPVSPALPGPLRGCARRP